MNAIVPFAFEDKLVRTVSLDDEPWFVGNDVCRALDLKNPRDAMSKLDEDEKGVANADTLGGIQEMIVVSEAGVYRLVFTSRKPEAERFKRWLAHEVLPALRRTGRFETRPAEEMPSEAISTLTVKLAMLREARLIFGPVQARELWFRLGLPAMPAGLRPTPDEDATAEGRACLAHLLARPTGLERDGVDETFGGVMREALDGDVSAIRMLIEAGIRFEPEVVWIADRGDDLGALFAGTRWEAAWRPALRGLPGAGPGAKVYKVDGTTTRGTAVPVDVIRAAL